ncbi:hypothetical protein CEB3_c20600 [Peptococcaceae bacterium CEB3]|nr:hypothetical protein CEB3_c20600 [Peptococcaceae bacterium CEB3]
MKKVCRGIVAFALAAAIGLSLAGCAHERVPSVKSQTATGPRLNKVDHGVLIVKDNAGEAGQGPLRKDNVALANIRIGESEAQVRKLYGKPSNEEAVHSTPFLGWSYKKLGLFVVFYRRSEQGPVRGVVKIQVSEPSALATNRGVGIGDSLASILSQYTKVCGFRPDINTNSQEIFINGAKTEAAHMVFYHPQLSFSLTNNRITGIVLSNDQLRP